MNHSMARAALRGSAALVFLLGYGGCESRGREQERQGLTPSQQHSPSEARHAPDWRLSQGARGGGPPSADGTVPLSEALEQLAIWRCEQHARCTGVGHGLQTNDRTECLQGARSSFDPQLSPTECSMGVEREALDRCLQAIRAGSCTPLGPTGELPSVCTPSQLCSHQGPR